MLSSSIIFWTNFFAIVIPIGSILSLIFMIVFLCIIGNYAEKIFDEKYDVNWRKVGSIGFFCSLFLFIVILSLPTKTTYLEMKAVDYFFIEYEKNQALTPEQQNVKNYIIKELKLEEPR